jgi:hypothetical protein
MYESYMCTLRKYVIPCNGGVNSHRKISVVLLFLFPSDLPQFWHTSAELANQMPHVLAEHTNIVHVHTNNASRNYMVHHSDGLI